MTPNPIANRHVAPYGGGTRAISPRELAGHHERHRGSLLPGGPHHPDGVLVHLSGHQQPELASHARGHRGTGEGGVKSSIHRTSWEQAYLSVAKPVRARTKVLVDGLAARVAEGLAAVALLLWLRFVVGDSADMKEVSTLWISALLLLGAVAWVASTRTLAQEIRARQPSLHRLDMRDALGAPLPGG